MSARHNSQWIGRVRLLLGEGYGAEDIALKTKSTLGAVRNEISILREMGVLKGTYGPGKVQFTNPILSALNGAQDASKEVEHVQA